MDKETIISIFLSFAAMPLAPLLIIAEIVEKIKKERIKETQKG